MSVCQTYGCDNRTDPGKKYCARCWEEIEAMSRPKNTREPSWGLWAVVVILCTFLVAMVTLL